MSATVWDEDINIEPVGTTSEEVVWDEDISIEPVITNQESAIAEMDLGSTNIDGAYTPSTYEEGGQTASPQDIQFAKDEELKTQMGDDIESITGATTSMYDNFKGDTKAFKKKEKEVKKLIEEKYGIRTEVRSGKKYLVRTNEEGLERAVEYPEGGNIFEALNAARGETGGALAGAQAGALAGGLAAGPVGAFAGGIIGGGIGAYGGAGPDIYRNKNKMDIEVSDKEGSRLQRHAGITDAVGGLVLGTIGKILSPSDIKAFTTIADMPIGKRRAVKHLAKQSNLPLADMENKIKAYAKSTDKGVISDLSAVEGAAKASEKEQTGYVIEAMNRSPSGKGNAIEETTTRTRVIEDSMARMDKEFNSNEFSNMVTKNTLDDEGRRKATNWTGLADDMKKFGFEDTDPIYKRVLENADTFGSKETDIFQGTVKATKPEDKAIPALDPLVNTTRSSVKSQGVQAVIEVVGKAIKSIVPGTDLHAVRTIKKALEEVKTPKEFKQTLLDEGIDKHIAEQVSRAYDNAMQDNKAFDASTAKTDNKAKYEELKDWKSKQGTIPKDLNRELTKYKDLGDWDAVETTKEAILKLATDKKEAIEAGIKTAKKDTRIDVLKRGTEAKKQIKSDYKDMKDEQFVDAEARKDTIAKGIGAKKRAKAGIEKTAKQEKRVDVIERAAEVKTSRAEAKAKVEATAQKEAEDLAVATRKQRTKEVTSKFEKESAKWEDVNPTKGFGKQYNLAKRDYKRAIGTEDENVARKEFDSIKKEIEDAKKEQEAMDFIDEQAKEQAKDDILMVKRPTEDVIKPKKGKTQEAKEGSNPAEVRKRTNINNVQPNGDTDVMLKAREAEIASDKARNKEKARQQALVEKEEYEAIKGVDNKKDAINGGKSNKFTMDKEVHSLIERDIVTEDDRHILDYIVNSKDHERKDWAKKKLARLNSTKPNNDPLKIKEQSSTRTNLVRKLGNEALNDFESAYKLSGLSGKWAEEARKYGGNLTGQLRRDFDNGLEEYHKHAGSISGETRDYLDGLPSKKRVKKQPADEPEHLKGLSDKEKAVVSGGRTITVEKARVAFMDEHGYDELVDALDWMAKSKANSKTGRSSSLGEYKKSVMKKRK